MRMLQSVSVNSKEQTIAHYSSRPTDLRIANLRGHKFPASLTLLSFKTSNRKAFRLIALASFPSVFFPTPAIINVTSRFFQLTGMLCRMTKTGLTFPACILFKISRFRSSILLTVSFHSTHEKQRSSQVWYLRGFP